MEIVRK